MHPSILPGRWLPVVKFLFSKDLGRRRLPLPIPPPHPAMNLYYIPSVYRLLSYRRPATVAPTPAEPAFSKL